MSYQADLRAKRRKFRRTTLLIILFTVLLLAALAPAAWYVSRYTQATVVFREAKDARLAIRLLSIQYSALDQPMNDSTQENGFAVGVGEDVCETANAPGSLHLIAWDDAQNIPLSFLYVRDDTVVYYLYDRAAGLETWRTVSMVPMMHFELAIS